MNTLKGAILRHLYGHIGRNFVCIFTNTTFDFALTLFYAAVLSNAFISDAKLLDRVFIFYC